MGTTCGDVEGAWMVAKEGGNCCRVWGGGGEEVL